MKHLILWLALTACASAQFMPFGMWKTSASVPLAVDTSRLIYSYPFNLTGADTTYRRLSLTANNSPGFTDSGVVSQAGKFFNGNEYWSINSDSVHMSGDSSWTISLWVMMYRYPTVSPFNTWIVCIYDNTDEEMRIDYLAGSTNRFRLEVRTATGYPTAAATSFGQPSVGAWYHIVAWFDADVDSIFIRVNNSSTDKAYMGTTGIARRRGAPLYVGGQPFLPERVLFGRIDQMCMWKRKLTASEITALYNNGSGRQWPFAQ